jgi:hypothetical protein
VTDSICKIATHATYQSGKNEYFQIPADAQNQGVSEFFTADIVFETMHIMPILFHRLSQLHILWSRRKPFNLVSARL